MSPPRFLVFGLVAHAAGEEEKIVGVGRVDMRSANGGGRQRVNLLVWFGCLGGR